MSGNRTLAAPRADGVRLLLAAIRNPLALVLLGLALAYGPTYRDLFFGLWAPYSQGHELIVLAVTAWLFYRQRDALAALPASRNPVAAGVLLAFGVLLYVVGRSQSFLRIELASQFFVLAALVVGSKGWAGLRRSWFPFVFLLFVIPLPHAATLALTGPLKAAVSSVTTHLLAAVGYPIGRAGVVITIGQYELLVATACAGLQTMISLEALGLLYANLRGYQSWVRNVLMALLVVPVSFCANVVRVVVLALIAYHFGDEAARSFIHSFAGIVLFMSALIFILVVDRALDWLLPARYAR